MVSAFEEHDIDVTFIFPTSKSMDIVKQTILAKIGKSPKYNIILINIKRNIVFGKSFFLYNKFKKKLKEKINSYDVIFTRHYLFNHLALSLGAKVIFEMHGISFSDYSLLNKIIKKVIKIDVRKENQLFLIAISNALKNYIISEINSNKKVLNLHDGFDHLTRSLDEGIEKSKSRLNLDIKKKYIIYIGSLYFDRNIEIIIKAAKQFKNEIFLIIGGPAHNISFYQQMCIELNVFNVLFVGHVSHAVVHDYMMAADILLIIYSWKVKTIEFCSPLKLFEFMGAGRIIIAQSFPTIKEILIDGVNALLCEPENLDDFIDKINIALTYSYPNKLAENAKNEAIAKYTWQTRTKAIIDEIKSE